MAMEIAIRPLYGEETPFPNVHEVANYFLNKSLNDLRPNTSITHLKLQKLVYYAQAWHLAVLRQPLFEERIEAWIHGPVVPDLYNTFRNFGYRIIPHNLVTIPPNTFAHQSIDILNTVWRVYGAKDAKDLEKLTHSELPWQRARNGTPLNEASNNEIENQIIEIYYANFINRG